MDTSPLVYVVDDDDAVRDALTLLLEVSGFAARGCASAQAFLDIYEPGRPACLVLDVRMPGTGGLELQELLSQREVDIPIIFITGHGEVPTSARAFRAGAVDFLEKPFSDAVLLDRVAEALTRVSRTRRHTRAREAATGRYAQLTPREREVMARVVAGSSSKEIARALGVSHRTVETHRARIMDKMHAESLAELMRMAAALEADEPGA